MVDLCGADRLIEALEPLVAALRRRAAGHFRKQARACDAAIGARFLDPRDRDLQRLVVGDRFGDQRIERRIAEGAPPIVLDLGIRVHGERRVRFFKLVPGRRHRHIRALRTRRRGRAGHQHKSGERDREGGSESYAWLSTFTFPVILFSRARIST